MLASPTGMSIPILRGDGGQGGSVGIYKDIIIVIIISSGLLGIGEEKED
jgi:hypothetical protein